MSVLRLRKELKKHRSREHAKVSQRFFKTGPGEYGEGDVFLGVKVPEIRRIARGNRDVPVEDAVELLRSPIHEERLLALLILVLKYAKGDDRLRKRIYNLYLKNTRHINNWDLVDVTAEHVVGAHLYERDRGPLYELAGSGSLWERRIAIMATFHFIKQNDFQDTLRLAENLLADPEDLIHKAVGWMLREVGKRDLPKEERFLRRHYRNMPRTLLRYAIERFPEPRRQAYLKNQV